MMTGEPVCLGWKTGATPVVCGRDRMVGLEAGQGSTGVVAQWRAVIEKTGWRLWYGRPHVNCVLKLKS